MMMKYKLTSESTYDWGRTLYRIEALRDFGDVKKGDKGGYIEKEENLSQESTSWVYDNAMVFGNARVSSNARVYDNASVSGNAMVCGDAMVSGNTMVCGNTRVSSGHCFASKEKNWDITEVPSGGGVLLIKDYKPKEKKINKQEEWKKDFYGAIGEYVDNLKDEDYLIGFIEKLLAERTFSKEELEWILSFIFGEGTRPRDGMGMKVLEKISKLLNEKEDEQI